MATVAVEPIERAEMLDERLVEIVDGVPRQKAMGAAEVDILSRLTVFLGQFVMQFRLGRIQVEMLYDMGTAGRPKRRPDLSYVSYQKWPRSKRIPSKAAFPVIPDIAIEVVSPSNSANEIESKIVEYLDAGVPQVWVIHPTTGRVYLHDGRSNVRVMGPGDDLVGGDLLPGFVLPLSQLFETEED